MHSTETAMTNCDIMEEITMMWFDETKIMMKWKTQWTRMYSVAVGICPYGHLKEHDEENMLSKYSFTERHGLTPTDQTWSHKWNVFPLIWKLHRENYNGMHLLYLPLVWWTSTWKIELTFAFKAANIIKCVLCKRAIIAACGRWDCYYLRLCKSYWYSKWPHAMCWFTLLI